MILEQRLKRITTFVFDVDGVMTNNSLLFGNTEIARVYNVKDGYAIAIAIKAGYGVAIITGGKQESIVNRMKSLGVQDIYIGAGTDQKPEILKQYLKKTRKSASEILYMGDDIPDYLLMKSFDVLAACPADAVDEVKQVAQLISPIQGGHGAVRNVIEQTLKAQNKWLKFF